MSLKSTAEILNTLQRQSAKPIDLSQARVVTKYWSSNAVSLLGFHLIVDLYQVVADLATWRPKAPQFRPYIPA